eukprot:TRINITY_DN6952_c0_g3_i1.p1 TRINITY_DN6952_c0_g3~~TRINITY_DN6952_c0_g3_i1.p1  ORF type:complete len:216 (+),score=35.38 TRINITY_DN6952_c0_g3_i1:76-723(+)
MSSALPFYGNRTPEQLKVSELREELKRRGIQCKGLKKELVERLDDAIQKELQEQRNALLAAQAPPEVEATAEPDPEYEPVVELKPVDPSPVPQPLPSVNDEPTDPPSHITHVQGHGTSPPDLNLALNEAHFEPKEPVLGPKQAFQSIELESETVGHAVEPETVPDSTPKSKRQRQSLKLAWKRIMCPRSRECQMLLRIMSWKSLNMMRIMPWKNP